MSDENKSNTLPLRSEIKIEDTWRLEDIYSDDALWELDFATIKDEIPSAQSHADFTGSSAKLLAAFRQRDAIHEQIGRLYTYAHMRYDQDTADGWHQGLNDRAKGLLAEVQSAWAFFMPEMLKIDKETIERFMAEEPDLVIYRKAIDDILKERPYILSDLEENLLAQASEVLSASSNTFGMLNNADLIFPTIEDENGNPVEITHGRYIKFLQSSKQSVRRAAFEGVYQTYAQFRNTLASTLSATVKKHHLLAKVHHYDSARHAALSANDIPEAVYDNLIAAIHDNIHLLKRYVKLRKKVLPVETLHMYDLYTPLVQEVQMKVTYEEAKAIIMKALEPMGEAYLEIIKQAFDGRWIDVYENKGKRSGAYSSGEYGTNPYILLNWQDNINSLFTLAHELGHSVHSYYTRGTQPYIYGDYSIFVAEVASTCNEALLQHYLVKNTEDEKQRLYILDHYLEGFRGTVFRQTMFAEFEHKIHQVVQDGDALTAEKMTAIYYNLNTFYFGQEDLQVDEAIGIEWARIPHFYYNYYVYQYATGFSAATALSSQILAEGAPAVERYVKFLKSGSSRLPIEVLKSAGVDMTSADPVIAACRVFETTLSEMERMLLK